MLKLTSAVKLEKGLVRPIAHPGRELLIVPDDVLVPNVHLVVLIRSLGNVVATTLIQGSVF